MSQITRKLSRETLMYEDCEDCQKKKKSRVAPKLLDVNMQCLFLSFCFIFDFFVSGILTDET